MAKRNDRSQPIPPQPWTENHAVARAIRTGNTWFDAWLANCSTPMPVVERKAKISMDRQWELIRGEAPTVGEIQRLAVLWKQSPEALAASFSFAEAMFVLSSTSCDVTGSLDNQTLPNGLGDRN